MSKMLEALVFEALGEASMCWSETPRGVFDDAKAKEIGQRLVASIQKGDFESSELKAVIGHLLTWAGLHRGKDISEDIMPRFHEILDELMQLTHQRNGRETEKSSMQGLIEG